MPKIMTLLASLCFELCFATVTTPSHDTQAVPVPQPASISMIQLIATPEKFDGKTIAVTGFLTIEPEDARLYFSQEDYRRNILDNGVWIDVNKEITKNVEELDLHYVVLVGIFREKGLRLHFPGGGGDGGITAISRCTPLVELTEKRPRTIKQK